ncbi:hypothetical protein ACFWDN_12975 [Micromonospora chalcea]
MSEKLTDILGNDISPGDKVIYPQMSGRSVQLTLGTLVSYNGKTAQIQREQGSRWSAGGGKWRAWRDKRTGKGIDPYAASGKHYKVKPRDHWVHVETGEEISAEEYRSRFPLRWGYYNEPQPERSRWQHKYDQGEWHDYVEEYTKPAPPVTITNVKNIVKVTLAQQ